MGRKNVIKPFKIVNEFPMSASFTSDAIVRKFPVAAHYTESDLTATTATNIEDIDVIGIITEWIAPTYYNATYLDVTATTAALSTLIGSPYAPDGSNLTNGQTVLFRSLTVVANRGVYKATVVGGNVTAWTRILYGQDNVTGIPVLADNVYFTAGTAAVGKTYFVDDATAGTWTDAGTTPVGTLEVQIASGFSDWLSIPLATSTSSATTTISISGATGNFNIDITDFAYEKMRLKYTRTSGSATMRATLTAKVVGA